ncbi:MAG: serine hydrolase [Phycisphaerales bacterium]|nr:MAG: serine hydrolase [Phycisphaerales bacterium]
MKRSVCRFSFATLVVLSLTCPSLRAGQTDTYSAEIKAFEQFVRQQMEVDRIPGLSVAFMKDDFLWARGFGYADLENKTPATERSSYRLASNTKSMTAVAILQLVEKGKVDLGAEVQKYVPYFPWKRWPVTPRELLGHLGGVSHYKDYDVEGHIKTHKDTRDALAIFADFDLVAEPGAKYEYSSYGYNLLGAVVEGAAKQPFGDYMREHLWKPLGMHDTHMDDPDHIIPYRVQGYRILDGKLKNSEYVDISSRFAAGGTRSTVVDLLKYATGLDAHKVLSPESTDVMYISLATNEGRFTDYGLGWVISPVNGRFHVFHTGGQPETRTLLVRFPKDKFAIALAYNLEGANLHVYSHRLVQLVSDEAWNVPAYVSDKVDAALYGGISEAFNYGLCYFTRYEKPRSTDSADLDKAFATFNFCLSRKALESNYKEARKRIAEGRHPVGEEAFVKVGSYVAMKLQEAMGPERIDVYHKRGAIEFFSDYVKICKKNRNDRPGLHLSEGLEKLVGRWSDDWDKTWNEYTRRLAITSFADLTNIGGRLKKLFEGREIYPDFTPEFARVTGELAMNGDIKASLGVAMLSAGLYPRSCTAHLTMATARACLGEKDKARAALKRALELHWDEPRVLAERVSKDALNLRENGRLDEAMALLEAAAGLLPKEPALYDSMAEIYVKKGEQLYRKVLEADPGHEHARKMLKKLE